MIPEGYKLVPVKPTHTMLMAAYDLPGPAGTAILEAYYRAMLSAAPEPPEAWRPIESAPKDGTTVLLYRRIHPWSVCGWGYWADALGIAGWIAFGFHEPPGNLGLGNPTHWMPLPAPPPKEPER